MNAQPATTQPSERVRLTEEQLARLEAAIIGRPARTYIDPYGNTRVTQGYINNFVSDLVKFHRARGYLTQNQYARVASIVEAKR